jgi:hypothetical protein
VDDKPINVKPVQVPPPERSLATGPRKIVPTKAFVARGLSAAGFSPAAPPPNLVYHGGPVLGSVQVVPIYWGNAWSSGMNAQLAAGLDGFFDFIVTSSLMDLLAEYSTPTIAIQRGQRLQSVRLVNSEPGSNGTVSDAQIQQSLQGWINNGTVPAVTANTLYFIYLPPNVTCTAFGSASCSAFCGYHDHIGGTIFYAVIPFVNCNGCQFPGNFLDTLTEVSSHEFCEAITDPALNAWWDPNPNGNDPAGDEIGDICNRQTVRLGGYLIQTEWSNQQNACTIASTGTPTNAFAPVYAQGDPGSGIGGYDLKSPADRAFAFDYDGSGKADHVALYRPGTGTMWILKNSGGNFSPVYHQGDPGNGIGGYDLKSPADLAFAFDYNSSGKLDHIVLYRPGTGTMWILKNSGGNFSPVYHEGDPGNGIGGYDLKSAADRAFAFDYDSSGKLDHIALYRPATGTMWILKNSGGNFSPVYHEGDPGNGIGGYDLKSSADLAFAFDYDSSGKLDHIALYRPATGTMWILKNSGGSFSPVYHEGDPGNGIGGYDLRSPADRAFAFDYDGSGKLDHLALYRPATGTMWILKNSGGAFSAVYHQGDPGLGIGGYDLKSGADSAFAFDYDASGKLDHLALYRPGTGTMWILKKQ